MALASTGISARKLPPLNSCDVGVESLLCTLCHKLFIFILALARPVKRTDRQTERQTGKWPSLCTRIMILMFLFRQNS